MKIRDLLLPEAQSLGLKEDAPVALPFNSKRIAPIHLKVHAFEGLQLGIEAVYPGDCSFDRARLQINRSWRNYELQDGRLMDSSAMWKVPSEDLLIVMVKSAVDLRVSIYSLKQLARRKRILSFRQVGRKLSAINLRSFQDCPA